MALTRTVWKQTVSCWLCVGCRQFILATGFFRKIPSLPSSVKKKESSL